MQGKFHQYQLTANLAKKYSHTTYIASPVNEPERQVVLILFTASLFSFPHEREAILRQAQRSKELQHPHLLPILDMGIEEEQPFVVRDYLPTESLRSRLKQLSPQQLELHEALTIVLQVGEALAYAHQQHILHGNVKPENIFFDTNGQVLLTDFTLVSRSDALIRNQTSEEYAFCYMAPEQFSGTIDARSDQYALGCLTYELITGKIPFAVQSLASMIGQYTYTQPIPLSEMVANIPPSLDAAVLKALAIKPDERFLDFSLFLEAIQAVLSPPPSFPLLRSTSSRKGRTTSRPMHSPQPQTVLSSLRQPPVSASPSPEAPNLFAPSHAEQERAEPVEAPTVANAHMPQQREKRSPLGDVLPTNPFVEQQSNHQSRARPAYEDHTFEMDEMAVSLPNMAYRDIPLARRTPPDSRKLPGMMLFFLIILAFAITAWGSYTVFFPLRTNTPDELAHQSPTQVVTPSAILIIETIPLTSPTTQLTVPIKPTASITSTPTVQPTVPVRSIPTPTPTPIPTPTPTLQTTAIDDSVIGTGLNQFNYVGSGWQHSSSVCPGSECHGTLPYNGSHSWDSKVNEYMKISFTGVQIKFYGIIDVKHGTGAASIDGGTETIVDFYAPSLAGNQLLWTSPMLPAGTHTFKLRVTGNKNPSSSGTTIEPDRADIVA